MDYRSWMGDYNGCMNKTSPQNTRWYLQFRLRSLLVVMLILSAYLAWKTGKANQQKAAVAWVQEMGGTVAYRHEVDEDFRPKTNSTPPAAQWLVELLGIDFFDQVVVLNLDGRTGQTIDDLTPLQSLRDLREARIGRTHVSDLTPLASLTKVQALDISSPRVSDLSPLARLTNLEHLGINHTSVADLQPLADLPRLRSLSCRGTKVTDLAPLSGCCGLGSLDLTETPVSDISPLAELRRLKHLDLRATSVSNLSPLAGMTQLRRLDLFDTPVVDLSALKNMPDLNVELGAHVLPDFKPVANMQGVKITLYKRPEVNLPEAFEQHAAQVRVSPIYKENR